MADSDPAVTTLAPVQQISVFLEALEGGARISWPRASPTPGGRHAGPLPDFATPLSDALASAVSTTGLASLPASVLRVVARCAARYRNHSLFASIAAHAAGEKFSGWTKEAVAELELLECMLELQAFGRQESEEDDEGGDGEHKEADNGAGEAAPGPGNSDGVFTGGKDGDGEDVDGDGVVTSEEMLEANRPRALENGRAFPAKELRRLAGALRRAEAFPDLLERSAELVGFVVQVGSKSLFRARAVAAFFLSPSLPLSAFLSCLLDFCLPSSRAVGSSSLCLRGRFGCDHFAGTVVLDPTVAAVVGPASGHSPSLGFALLLDRAVCHSHRRFVVTFVVVVVVLLPRWLCR